MIYPMYVMILITIGYGVYTAYIRVNSVVTKEINPRYYKTMSGYEVPRKIEISTRHFGNLLETPPLFYIAGALIIAMGLESTFTNALGWLYVISRLAHTYIHNTYNFPLHRMIAFGASAFFILILWTVLVFSL